MESKQKIIKKMVIEYLQDGKIHDVKEIREKLNEKGIKVDSKSSALRISLCNLKKEKILDNPEMGKYCLKRNAKVENKNSSKYDFTEFEIIKSVTRKNTQLVMAIFEDGTVSLNTKLLELFPEHNVEIRIKKDCSQIALFPKGNSCINVGKNGRIKNYDIVERIKKSKIKLPTYYVGEWDDDEIVWIGERVQYNPNRGYKIKGS